MIKIKKTKLISTGMIFGALAVLGGTLAISKKLKNDTIQRLLGNEIYCTGNIRKFGTLYLDNEKQKNPSDFLEFEDVPIYKEQKIEIGDTDRKEENQLSWIEINDNNKKLLICDRNILKEVSWNELNNQNLIFGKVVIIEGKKYILRLLTGDNEKNSYKSNEWDRYIANNDNIEGLPISTDYDKDTITNEDDEAKLNGDNNILWNWYNFSSLTQSENSRNKKLCIVRGFYSTTYSNNSNKDLKYETVGYRPVLELIE